MIEGNSVKRRITPGMLRITLRILKTSINGQKNLFLNLNSKETKPYWTLVAATAKSLPNLQSAYQTVAAGIDSSAQMIKLAKNTFHSKDYPNLSFQVMDARKLIFRAEFDLIFSNAALHWILDQKAVLQGVQRCLKTGGRLLFQMAGKGNAQAVLGILDALLMEKPWKEFFEGFAFPYGFFSVEEYKAFLVDVGLQPLRVELFSRDMKHAGEEGLAGWIRTTWLPYTERLPI